MADNIDEILSDIWVLGHDYANQDHGLESVRENNRKDSEKMKQAKAQALADLEEMAETYLEVVNEVVNRNEEKHGGMNVVSEEHREYKVIPLEAVRRYFGGEE